MQTTLRAQYPEKVAKTMESLLKGRLGKRIGMGYNKLDKQYKEKSGCMTRSMTEGGPAKLILLFTLPLLGGNLFQQLYNNE